MMNAATWAFVADFNRAQSWNKVGETLRSKFVQDLRLEQRGNKVSQEGNIIGTNCEWEHTWNRLGTDLEHTWNKLGIFIPTLFRTYILQEHPWESLKHFESTVDGPRELCALFT